VAEEAEPTEPTREEVIEQVQKLRVTDVLLSTMAAVAQLAYAKLDAESCDLPQAKVGIDSLRALLPVLEESLDDELVRDYRQLVSNLQLAYAEAAAES
jgi:hypothetical protein